MSFTYDPSTVVGQVRFLADDRDEPTALFTDAELQTCLDLNDQRVRLAAAQALDVKAADRAWIQGKIQLDGLSTDGTAVAAALRSQAAELRRQEVEGGGDDAGFDIAEMDLDVFSLRQILVNRMLREQT